MSEYINNREYRQKVLKELIRELHDGKTVEDVKERFDNLIRGISSREIAEMEQALVMEGMPIEEIQRLCDVHAAVFKGSIEDIHKPENVDKIHGHPVDIFKRENRELEKLINDSIKPALEKLEAGDQNVLDGLLNAFTKLWEVDKHYLRKENILFPYLEKYGITSPPKVMWGVDDEIRKDIKDTISLLKTSSPDTEKLLEKAKDAVHGVVEMIFKEENILFPMAMETLAKDEWSKISHDSDEIGYCLLVSADKYEPVSVDVEQKAEAEGEPPASEGYIKFETGILTQEEISGMFNTLPFDLTFVDKDGLVKYFSQGKERIFPRTKAVIGREVKNCHPPASVHIVEKIVEDLQSGKKDHEDFWIKMKDMYVFIRYFAVRNDKGEFLGVLEVTQNIAPIQEITGEKRLLED